VIPVFNEKENLLHFVPELVEFCQTRNWKLIFVNDGSTDGSGSLLDDFVASESVKVLHHKLNRGYGGALKTGINCVETNYLVTIDADGQHDIQDVEKVYKFAIEQDADLVIGNRGKNGDMNLYRAIGKRLIRIFTSALISLPVSDLNSGFKLYRTDLARRYQLICPDSMSFSDVITLIFIHKRARVLEHPITIYPRNMGISTINTHTAMQTVMEILNIILLFNPLRILLPVSAFFIFSGFLWGTLIYFIRWQGLSVAAMLFIMTGLILFILGLLANQISAMRMEQLEK
jgi:glycosyltransferase involved in cell wall biosynthesis